MKRLQPVVWSKGTLLAPQHLQVQDRFIESLLQFRLNAQKFRPWGFLDLAVNQEALSEGEFTITRAAGLFPDGLAFDIPESDAAPPPKQIQDLFEEDEETIELFLAIPPLRQSGINVAMAVGGGDSRFVAEAASFRDENSGATEKAILLARKNFRILAGTEVQQGLSAVRLARVRRTPASTYELDPSFVPPLLVISASDYVLSIARRLVEILAAKSTDLAALRGQVDQSLSEFTVSDVANFWLLYTVNTYFTHLRHIFETKRGHPEELFSVMLALAGALTTFSRQVQPSDFPAYDHDALGPCLTDLDEKLRLLLETVVPRNFVSLRLKRVRPSIYATAIDDRSYLVNTKMYLAITANTDQAELIRMTPQLIKLGSADRIDELVGKALRGLQLTHAPRGPAAVPLKMNHQYFSLNQSGEAWDSITRARTLAAYVPSEIPDPSLELIVLLPQGK
ncbi:MAG: type VI secretion system baseplate subunit TssK [bacterium]|nr:type VI secretion system baseplate subunit TssK [bacterium]